MNVNVRLYNFPLKTTGPLKTVGFETKDVDGTTLMGKVSEILEIKAEEIDLFFRGKKIAPDDGLLSSTGFHDGNSIQVFYKPAEEESEPEANVDRKELLMCMNTLHGIMTNRHNRWKSRKIGKIVTNPHKFKHLIESVPGLKNDSTAQSILRNPDLLGHTSDPKNIERILELYPKVGAAIILLVKMLKTELQASGNENPSTSNEYGMWQLNGNGQEEMDTDSPMGAPSNARQIPHNSLITSNQLAQALAMANSPQPGRIFPSPMGSTPSSSMQSPQTGSTGNNTASGSGSNAITPDVFSLAMQQAMAQANVAASPDNQQQPPAPDQTLSPEVMENGLKQLRGMGIYDEEASRQALQVAGGNIETAVNILFSSGMDET